MERVLFYKARFSWPRSSGHDVHTCGMMSAMSARGVQVSVAALHPIPAEALRGISIAHSLVLDGNDVGAPPTRYTNLQERFRSYWGIPETHVRQLGRFARETRADAVVVSGLDVLPMLGAVDRALRIWYAADEWLWHHSSLVRLSDPSTWHELHVGLTKALYERAYASMVDRAWVVTEGDRRAMRLVAGMRNVDIIENGVDASFYSPAGTAGSGRDAVFWGRLDFGPNIQAIEWFVARVWPLVRAQRPEARFTIIGFSPTPQITRLAGGDGIELIADSPDIRPIVASRSVVVLPFVSGGGVKNKLLEAAAMGKPIVASPRATIGLRGNPPLAVVDTPQRWVAAILRFWDDANARRAAGCSLRNWVVEHHTWDAAARVALGNMSRRGEGVA